MTGKHTVPIILGIITILELAVRGDISNSIVLWVLYGLYKGAQHFFA